MTRYFSITQLAFLAGIKAHTLRMWEKRYALFTPHRSAGNQRLYSVTELDHLLKVVTLNKAGYKISSLIELDTITLRQHLADLDSEEIKRHREINQLIAQLFALDIEEFEAGLTQCISLWGLDKTVSLIILPLLERTQLLSCKNCEIEMDFAMTALRKKMILAVEKATPLVTSQQTALLFLPQGEHYDLLLLYYCYLLKSSGMKVLYMGTNVSLKKVKWVVERKQPDIIITYLSPVQKNITAELDAFVKQHLTHETLFAVTLQCQGSSEQEASRLRLMHPQQLSEYFFHWFTTKSFYSEANARQSVRASFFSAAESLQ